MKKKLFFICLFFTVVLSLNVIAISAGTNYDGVKGECPDAGFCASRTTCPAEGEEPCAPGYYCWYCDEMFDHSCCEYAGEHEDVCAAVVRDRPYWTAEFVNRGGYLGCFVVENQANEYWAGPCGECEDDTTCHFIGSPYSYQCLEDHYCADTGSEVSCAPPDYSEAHCEASGGSWDSSVGRCGEPSCNDGKMNGDETGIDCGGLCESCGFDGVKGECPDAGFCASRTTCPAEGEEPCAPGYYCWYCDEMFDHSCCEYAGEHEDVCDAVVRERPYWESEYVNMGGYWGCRVTENQANEYWAGPCGMCEDDTTCHFIGSPYSYQCLEGHYCADTGSEVSCAPPDYSEAHCEASGGSWDAANERCSKGVTPPSEEPKDTPKDLVGLNPKMKEYDLQKPLWTDADTVIQIKKSTKGNVLTVEKKVSDGDRIKIDGTVWTVNGFKLVKGEFAAKLEKPVTPVASKKQKTEPIFTRLKNVLKLRFTGRFFTFS